jgi:hypothetical protein
VDDHREHWPLNAKGFRRWLARKVYEKKDKIPNAQALVDAMNVLAGNALFEGLEYPVSTRLAEHEGCIYLDLANERWESIAIDSTGWRVVSNPPVRFRRSRGMLPLPYPAPDRTLIQFRQFANISDANWALVGAWLVAAPRPRGPYPILVLHAEQGSGKSTVQRMVRALLDPNAAGLRSEPREPRDLMIAATSGWVVSYDNLSHVPTWLSDALCRLSTGGGFATRELYSDSDEVLLFDAQRPVILNGIEEVVTRGDALDRAVIVGLDQIPEDKRRPEAELWAAFDAARPRLLGALLEAIATALRNLPKTTLEKLPRMADFAIWATAAESALGIAEGAFMTAYQGNQRDANDLALHKPLPSGRLSSGSWPIEIAGSEPRPSC